MHQPILLDLFCGAGGWSKPFLALGWRCIGFDVADHGYPGELRLGALPVSPRILHELGPELVVASPPCEDFARAHLPWLRSVAYPSTHLLRWSIALGQVLRCPVIIECSKFAARHVPGARFCHPYALWGDVPALLPAALRSKDSRRGSSRLSPAERTRRAAMIDPELAGWVAACAHAGRVASPPGEEPAPPPPPKS